MVNQVLCACVWCLQVSDGQSKFVNQATRTRHLKKQKKTWSNQADLSVFQQCFITLSTPLLVETTVALSMPLQMNILILFETNQYNYDIDMCNIDNQIKM